MRALLDSQAVLWAMTRSPRLSASARNAIADPANEILVSSVSPYELEWKKANGRLQFPDIADWEEALAQAGYRELPLRLSHAVRAATLPKHHRDPWDRMLVAQALEEGLMLLSSDRKLSSYGVTTLW
ncbi:MAG: type II toxin-antitoxin system VapC family toxin [Hyphomonadaceae bacterium]|nr:type II toxin-antitoxin system VapC family toxin [Hyphomonadaceae bacterium]